jgi:hypothetical protein
MYPIIFCHFGYSEYLEYTLRQAGRSNPSRPKILIGDLQNLAVAERCGWQHVRLTSLRSERRDRFNARFRWVQGKDHKPVIGSGDWLRFVSERFFCIDEFLRSTGTPWYWHFDSDTMIVQPLERWERLIEQLDLETTTLCDGFCPSGLVSAAFIVRYCEDIIRQFSDDELLDEHQRRFDTQTPRFAYTEMSAFHEYLRDYSPRVQRLGSVVAPEGWWFDDCVCRSDDLFEMTLAERLGATLKDLRREEDRIVCASSAGVLGFASVNCSWVPLDVFDWVEKASVGHPQAPARLSDVFRMSGPEKMRRVSSRMLRRMGLRR